MQKKANFTEYQLRRDIFNVSSKEHDVFIPNEFFSELVETMKEETKCKSSTHIAYAFAYNYLAHYMYRYCKHSYLDGYNEINIDEKMIKQILGFSAKADQFSYITKKGGLLEKMGYIEKSSDVPVEFYYEKIGDKIDYVDFTLADKKFTGNTKNRKINVPVKGFHRDEEAVKDGEINGTFYDVQYTTNIDFDVFMYCMSDVELGVEGFYLYSFLKFKNDYFKGGFDCSNKMMAYHTGLSMHTVKTMLKALEERNMIDNDHKPFCLAKPSEKVAKANTYKVKSKEDFARNLREFIEIPKQRKLSVEAYESEIGFVDYGETDEDVKDNTVDIGDIDIKDFKG